MELGLAGSVIVVTGGASGIGEAISRACLQEGARVVILSRITPQVGRFMDEIAAVGAACELVETELGDVEPCRRAVAHVDKVYGSIDGLVNNAGVNDSVGLASGSPERFLASLRENLLHYYALAHFALPLLKRTRGSIVNVSSKVALTGQGGTSGYAASKGGQLALTREWAAELLPFGIRVNAVVPAEVLTPQYQSRIDAEPDPAQEMERIVSKIPLGHRMTRPEEIAAAVVFLLSSRQSGHTTGQHIVVDGGYTHLDRALT